jgi:hypothetical protein
MKALANWYMPEQAEASVLLHLDEHCHELQVSPEVFVLLSLGQLDTAVDAPVHVYPPFSFQR